MRGGAEGETWGQFFSNGFNSAKTGVTSSWNSLTGPKKSECPTCPPCNTSGMPSYQSPPYQSSYSSGQGLNPSLAQPAGGRRRKRGGFQAYYPPDTWSSMYPYPAAVGGTKKRRGGNRRGTGGSNPMPYYPPDAWTNMYPYPAAVGGKKRRNKTYRRK